MDKVSLENWKKNKDPLTDREDMVFNAIVDLGGIASGWDIMNYLDEKNPNKVKPRLTGLKEKGYIHQHERVIKIIDGMEITEWRWKITEDKNQEESNGNKTYEDYPQFAI